MTQRQTLQDGGFTPREAAASFALEVLMDMLRRPNEYLANEKTGYRRATLKAAHKLAMSLADRHRLETIIPDPE